jgi:hypothetical protein
VLPAQVAILAVVVAVMMITLIGSAGDMAAGANRYRFANGTACSAACALDAAWNPMRCVDSFGLEYLLQGRCSAANQYGPLSLWVPAWIAGFLMGNDVRKKKNFNEKLQLAPGRRYHFFICHHQGSGGNQAQILCLQLRAVGCKVWYDNDQEAGQRNLQGMRRGVRESACLLIFLSGRCETDGEPDRGGLYEGPFTRWSCHAEMAAAPL